MHIFQVPKTNKIQPDIQLPVTYNVYTMPPPPPPLEVTKSGRVCKKCTGYPDDDMYMDDP